MRNEKKKKTPTGKSDTHTHPPIFAKSAKSSLVGADDAADIVVEPTVAVRQVAVFVLGVGAALAILLPTSNDRVGMRIANDTRSGWKRNERKDRGDNVLVPSAFAVGLVEVLDGTDLVVKGVGDVIFFFFFVIQHICF